MNGRGISLQVASNLISSLFGAANELGLPPLCAIVLDSGGHVKSALSQDGVGTLRFEIAKGKAAAALGMGMDTIDLYRLFEQGVLPDRFAGAVIGVANGMFVPQPGGAILRRKSQVIGAIGVSGASSDKDEAVMRQAMVVTKLA